MCHDSAENISKYTKRFHGINFGMPLTRRGLFQFGLLLLCVPTQYYLSGLSNDTSSAESRQKSILNIAGELQHFRDSWFSFQAWKDTYMNFIVWIVRDLMGLVEGDDESIAIEVLQYREQMNEKIISDKRPKIVLFRVGQVVGFKEGYKGTIIGWRIDEKEGMPIYSILLDEGESNRAREPLEVSQESLYGVEQSMVKNRLLKHYFSSYDGTQYVPLPWLKEKYPRD